MTKGEAPAGEHPEEPAKCGCGHDQRLVREVMSSAAVTVLPTATVHDALRTLEAHHLHNAPVVTAEGRLVGVISDTELRRAIRLPALEAIDPAGCLHHQMPYRNAEQRAGTADERFELFSGAGG